jgi:hypothetical protein
VDVLRGKPPLRQPLSDPNPSVRGMLEEFGRIHARMRRVWLPDE